MSNFSIVFPDGTTLHYEGAVIRFTPDDSSAPIADFPVEYLMQTLADVDDIRDAMVETLKYPEGSLDPAYGKALYDLDEAMAVLFGDVLPPVEQAETIDSGIEIGVTTQAPPEPEFWN